MKVGDLVTVETNVCGAWCSLYQSPRCNDEMNKTTMYASDLGIVIATGDIDDYRYRAAFGALVVTPAGLGWVATRRLRRLG